MTKRASGLLDLPPSGEPPADTGGRPYGIMGLSSASVPADRTPAAIEATENDMFEVMAEACRVFWPAGDAKTAH